MKFSTNGTGKSVVSYNMGARVEVPLILLHGFCADSGIWANVYEHLGHTGQIMIDLPGFGQSGIPNAPNMEEYAGAVKTVLEHQGIKQCVLVGHSMGGYAALEFAARYPKHLAGLGLINSHPYADTPERRETRLRGIEALRAGKRDLYVSQFVPNLFAPGNVGPLEKVVETLIELGQEQSALGLEMALMAMFSREDHQETLAQAICPVLFLLGQADPLVPPELALPAALLPQVAELHLLPGTGHLAMIESHNESARILSDFWELCTKIMM